MHLVGRWRCDVALCGTRAEVMAKYADGSLKKTTDALRQEIIAMVQERFPPQVRPTSRGSDGLEIEGGSGA